MPPSRLARCIVPPNKLVKALNWKNTSVLLALNITDSSIGVSYTSIPKSADGRAQRRDFPRNIFESYQVSTEAQRINPIQYMPSNVRRGQICRRDETVRLADEIYEVSMDVKASGFLVSWPLTTGGKMGKDCGKVLHVLDALAGRLNGPAMSPHRPCCLWDSSKYRTPSRVTKTNCSVSEKMAQNLLGMQQRELLQVNAATHQVEEEGDASDLASFVLQEFINLNWKPLQSQLPCRDAEAQLVRNRRLNDAFALIDEPDKAQLQLLM